MNPVVLALIGITVLFLIILISIYNGLIRRKNQVDNAFGAMDAQLKKRYDLIPNLVATVKQYASHEKEILERVTQLRNKALESGKSAEEKARIDTQMSSAIKGLMVSVEAYPDLKANTNFLNLQRNLNEVESQLSAARRAYNASITDYNNGIETFPQNLIAGMMNMRRKDVFEINQQERENVDVNKLFN